MNPVGSQDAFEGMSRSLLNFIERALPEWRLRGLGTLFNERADIPYNSGGRFCHLCLDGQRDAVGRHLVGGRWYAV